MSISLDQVSTHKCRALVGGKVERQADYGHKVLIAAAGVATLLACAAQFGVSCYFNTTVL